GAPNPLHRADREATVARHAARTPVGRSLRLAFQRAGDHGLDALVFDRTRCAGAWFITQALDPLNQKPAAPLTDRYRMHAKLLAGCLVLQTFGTGQDDPRSLGQRLRRLWPRRQRPQLCAFSFRQYQLFQPSSGHACLRLQRQKSSQAAPNRTKCRLRIPDMTDFRFGTLGPVRCKWTMQWIDDV